MALSMTKAASVALITPPNNLSINHSFSSSSSPTSLLSVASSSVVSSSFAATRCRISTTHPSWFQYPSSFSSFPHRQKTQQLCRAAEYVFPDPIPEFAQAETEKFRTNLLKKLSKKDIYGDSVDEVVAICAEIFSNFLHTEYGGPGTLLVIPFIDMADTLNERGLPGGPQAARAAVVWAQKHVDKDWHEWTGSEDGSDQ